MYYTDDYATKHTNATFKQIFFKYSLFIFTLVHNATIICKSITTKKEY